MDDFMSVAELIWMELSLKRKWSILLMFLLAGLLEVADPSLSTKYFLRQHWMDESDGSQDSIIKHKPLWATYYSKYGKKKKTEKKKHGSMYRTYGTRVIPVFGIFPSWGLSQKLSHIIGPNRAREVSLTALPITAELAEKWGLVNHVVETGDVLKKAKEIAEAIMRNNSDMVFRFKSVINDGFKLDLTHALTLEKERGHSFYDSMTKEQFANMEKFIASRSSKPSSKL